MSRYFVTIALFLISLSSLSATEPNENVQWSRLPALPDRLGFAGPIVGTIEESLIVAGGANFPDGPPWTGGKKVWHDTIYRLRPEADEWETIGHLPTRLGYAVSGSYQEGIIFAGGSDSERHHQRVWHAVFRNDELKDKRLFFRELPSLPHPLAYAAGGIDGPTLFVTCGSREPGEKKAENRTFTLDLSNAEAPWRESALLPGPARILPTVGFAGGDLYLFGGAALEADATGTVKRRYLNDAWRLRVGGDWERLADLPRALVAAPGPAPLIGEDRFLLLGGDDGSAVGFQPIEKHPGFSRRVLTYDFKQNRYRETSPAPIALVTTSLAKWGGKFILPSGEVRPGVRSPEVHAFTFPAPSLQPTRTP